jgi:hypothetical protein
MPKAGSPENCSLFVLWPHVAMAACAPDACKIAGCGVTHAVGDQIWLAEHAATLPNLLQTWSIPCQPHTLAVS